MDEARGGGMNAATLSTVEAATMLGKTRHCIRLWCETGQIACTKDPVSGCYRIPEDAVLKLSARTKSVAQRKCHTLAEAAAILGISRGGVQRLCECRHVAFLKLPTGRILIETTEIDRLIERYRQPAGGTA